MLWYPVLLLLIIQIHVSLQTYIRRENCSDCRSNEDEEFDSMYENFKKQFNKEFDDDDLHELSRDCFKKRNQLIQEQNDQFTRGEVTWKMEHNRFSDLPEDQLFRVFGYVPYDDDDNMFLTEPIAEDDINKADDTNEEHDADEYHGSSRKKRFTVFNDPEINKAWEDADLDTLVKMFFSGYITPSIFEGTKSPSDEYDENVADLKTVPAGVDIAESKTNPDEQKKLKEIEDAAVNANLTDSKITAKEGASLRRKRSKPPPSDEYDVNVADLKKVPAGVDIAESKTNPGGQKKLKKFEDAAVNADLTDSKITAKDGASLRRKRSKQPPSDKYDVNVADLKIVPAEVDIAESKTNPDKQKKLKKFEDAAVNADLTDSKITAKEAVSLRRKRSKPPPSDEYDVNVADLKKVPAGVDIAESKTNPGGQKKFKKFEDTAFNADLTDSKITAKQEASFRRKRSKQPPSDKYDVNVADLKKVPAGVNIAESKTNPGEQKKLKKFQDAAVNADLTDSKITAKEGASLRRKRSKQPPSDKYDVNVADLKIVPAGVDIAESKTNPAEQKKLKKFEDAAVNANLTYSEITDKEGAPLRRKRSKPPPSDKYDVNVADLKKVPAGVNIAESKTNPGGQKKFKKFEDTAFNADLTDSKITAKQEASFRRKRSKQPPSDKYDVNVADLKKVPAGVNIAESKTNPGEQKKLKKFQDAAVNADLTDSKITAKEGASLRRKRSKQPPSDKYDVNVADLKIVPAGADIAESKTNPDEQKKLKKFEDAAVNANLTDSKITAKEGASFRRSDLKKVPAGVNIAESKTNPGEQKKLKKFEDAAVNADLTDSKITAKEGASIPDTKDWRDEGAVTPVIDQGGCAGCWSFSTIGSLESHYYLKYNRLYRFSSQQVLDCCNYANCNGCEKGSMYAAFQYLAGNGTATNRRYPFIQEDEECYANEIPTRVRIKTHYKVKSEDDMLTVVGTIGPIAVGIDATDLLFYKSGIFQVSDCGQSLKDLNHAVLIVGYGSEDGLDYWICKNSWGTSWGEEGYFRILRGVNMCGIANLGRFPVL